MSNRLHPMRVGVAYHLFTFGWSIRQVSKMLGISRETANRIQKDLNMHVAFAQNDVWVNTGAKKDRSLSSKNIGPQLRDSWSNRNQYFDEWEFRKC